MSTRHLRDERFTAKIRCPVLTYFKRKSVLAAILRDVSSRKLF